MPWKECTSVSLRREFVVMCQREGSNVALLCQRYGVSRKTAYKWLRRYREEGERGLADQSRRPQCSPGRTAVEMEQQVVTIRDKHPAWGGRKIHARLRALGLQGIPAASTITAILHRHERISLEETAKHRPFVRFERSAPNDLWQIDFKGHWPLPAGGRCHPLTVLDDHSRFALGLRACSSERTETVQGELTTIFRCYGLPREVLADNGPPWGGSAGRELTSLGIWLVRLGIAICHGRPRHPQTQGKDERFHRTLKAEVLRGPEPQDLRGWQREFDVWREVYNQERPHEALGMEVPARRYGPSPRAFPEVLPSIEYGLEDTIRPVRSGGEIHFHGKRFYVAEPLRGLPVALRPTATDGVWNIYFCSHQVKRIDLRTSLENDGSVLPPKSMEE